MGAACPSIHHMAKARAWPDWPPDRLFRRPIRCLRRGFRWCCPPCSLVLAMVLELYLDLLSQPCRAVYIFAKKNNIPFMLKAIEMLKGQQFSEEFNKVNILRKVPVLKDGDFILEESTAILLYLTRKYNTSSYWYPPDMKKRARVDEYLAWESSTIRASASKILWLKVRPAPLTSAAKHLAGHCAGLPTRLRRPKRRRRERHWVQRGRHVAHRIHWRGGRQKPAGELGDPTQRRGQGAPGQQGRRDVPLSSGELQEPQPVQTGATGIAGNSGQKQTQIIKPMARGLLLLEEMVTTSGVTFRIAWEQSKLLCPQRGHSIAPPNSTALLVETTSRPPPHQGRANFFGGGGDMLVLASTE
ncbi:uncharacterized protein LOC103050281 isoform X2 [Python bivittatus]|uniref:Uncharacterized protein LOC103050281 isoform X2 n=1 Tax=Python bivittatus TaxID=176946 RepID=A0A9F5J979_PYTBI|nr:uncharacterized protein LOC103050281 isoform X2 [Python bivittatus]